MELKDFVKKVVLDLTTALQEARDDEHMKHDVRFATGTNGRTIAFDVAVAVEQANGAQGKAGIRVLRFAEAGGNITEEQTKSTVSRITFGVNIPPRTLDEEESDRASTRDEPHGGIVGGLAEMQF